MYFSLFSCSPIKGLDQKKKSCNIHLNKLKQNIYWEPTMSQLFSRTLGHISEQNEQNIFALGMIT